MKRSENSEAKIVFSSLLKLTGLNNCVADGTVAVSFKFITSLSVHAKSASDF